MVGIEAYKENALFATAERQVPGGKPKRAGTRKTGGRSKFSPAQATKHTDAVKMSQLVLNNTLPVREGNNGGVCDRVLQVRCMGEGW